MATEKRLSREELEKTQEYQSLTPKQQHWVSTYVEIGISTGKFDAVDATLMSYKCKNREVARIMSYSITQNTRIIDVLNLFYGSDPVQSFLKDLNRAIRNKHLTQAQVTALNLKARVLGIPNIIKSDETSVPVLQPELRPDRSGVGRGKKKAKAEPEPVAAPAKPRLDSI